MPEKPTIRKATIVAESRLFRLETLDLEFSNGTVREYERVRGTGSGRGAVLIVPMLDDDTVLLIRESPAGVHRYELALPKGRVEGDEELVAAANRELMEEVGHAARELEVLTSFTVAPGYLSHVTHVVLARGLYPRREPGDEPEELEVVPWSLGKLPELVALEEVTEARSIAALYMVRERLHGNGSN
ncbi:MAG: ADP compounds hydrolase NudE [Thiohalospira sp.]